MDLRSQVVKNSLLEGAFQGMAVFQNARRVARLTVIAGPPIVLAIVVSRFGMWDGVVGAVVVLAMGVWIGASALYTSNWKSTRRQRRRK